MDAISVVLGGAVGAGVATWLRRSGESHHRAEGVADVIQWAFLVKGPEEAVVMCKDGALLAGWRYHGPDLESAAAEDLAALNHQVNDALLAFGDGWMWHVDAIRRKAEPYPADPFPAVSPEAPDVSVPAWIDAERRAAYAADAGDGAVGGRFVSEFVATLTYLPPPAGYERLARAFVKDDGTPRASAAAVVSQVLEDYERQAAALVRRLGGRFHLTRLDAADLTTHLASCYAGTEHPVAPPPVGAYLMSVLASQEFTPGFVPRVGRQHVYVVGIESYPAETPGADVQRLDLLNRLAVPYRWSSRFIALSQPTADKVIRQHRQAWFAKRKDLGTFFRDMFGSSDQNAYKQQQEEELFGNQDASAMLRDLNAARAENASGTVRYGYSTQVVVVRDEDRAVAERRAAAVEKVLNEAGYATRIETINAPDAFFGSIPGHGYYNLRRLPLHSRNLAGLWPLTGVWPGLPHNPSQFFPPHTSPLFYAGTDGSTPYRFHVHHNDVGHVLLFGGTGGGKSTFLTLTTAGWYRYPGARTVIFDFDYSHYLFARARGARHFDLLSPEDPDGVVFQPLADVDDAAERAWAAGWLETLVTMQGVKVTPAHRVALARALDLLSDAARAERTLTAFQIQVQDAELRAALEPYLAGGPFGQLFDGAEDATAGAGDHQVYELKHLLDLPDTVVVPAFDYLAHRVERGLDGRPTLIICEEMHAVLRGPFPERHRRWLLTLRKRNGAVVSVFHTPAQLDGLAAKGIVVGSCPTRVFLPNAEAPTPENAALYREYGLNGQQIKLIAEASPKRDYYVTSPLGARKISLDLGPVALAFVSTPRGMTPREVRAEVASLAARHGAAWPRAWLARLGVRVPAGAVIGSAPAPVAERAPVGAPPAPGLPLVAADAAEEFAHVEGTDLSIPYAHA